MNLHLDKDAFAELVSATSIELQILIIHPNLE